MNNEWIEDRAAESVFPYGTRCYRKGRALCAVSHNENGLWHISISRKDRIPTYGELKEVRYHFCPDVPYMAQIFPPTAEFVNVHENCLHLHEITPQEMENKNA